MRVVGVDPGTRSFDVCGLEDGRIALDRSYPSRMVADTPERIAAEITDFAPELLVGPSGYGVPLKRAAELTRQERFELTLEFPEDAGKIPVLVGVQRLASLLAEEGLNVWLMPGVIHLPTVPPYRKLNRIDMGTADKVAIALLAVESEARRHGIPYEEVSFVLLEAGFGYNAALAVGEGRVVDGIGGTMFPGMGFVNMGCLDGEVAYLMGGFEKSLLFSGGAADLTAGEPIPPEEFARRVEKGEERALMCLDAYAEGAVRAAAMEMALVSNPALLLSGRLSRDPLIRDTLRGRIREKLGADTHLLSRLAPESESKEAAQGAALLADGLAGGTFAPLVEHMKIREASGSVFDHVFLPRVYRGPEYPGPRQG